MDLNRGAPFDVQTSSIPVFERMWSSMESGDPAAIFVKTNDEGG